jgi:3-deoxy-D-arabino-heptulosonate 7-phosphate (DAHP) synthase class II
MYLSAHRTVLVGHLSDFSRRNRDINVAHAEMLKRIRNRIGVFIVS